MPPNVHPIPERDRVLTQRDITLNTYLYACKVPLSVAHTVTGTAHNGPPPQPAHPGRRSRAPAPDRPRRGPHHHEEPPGPSPPPPSAWNASCASRSPRTPRASGRGAERRSAAERTSPASRPAPAPSGSRSPAATPAGTRSWQSGAPTTATDASTATSPWRNSPKAWRCVSPTTGGTGPTARRPRGTHHAPPRRPAACGPPPRTFRHRDHTAPQAVAQRPHPDAASTPSPTLVWKAP